MSDVTRRMAKGEAQVKATQRPWHQGGKGKEELMSPNTIFGADGAAIAQFYGISLHKTFDELDTKLCAEGLGNIATVLRAVNNHGKLLEALKAYDKAVTSLTDQQLIDNQPLMSAVLNGRAAIQSAEEQPK